MNHVYAPVRYLPDERSGAGPRSEPSRDDASEDPDAKQSHDAERSHDPEHRTGEAQARRNRENDPPA